MSFLIRLASLACVVLVIFSLSPIRGEGGQWLLGHDYSHYFARIYLGATHFWQSGWSVPHFTPYLCGGMPFFADPQAIYYSLPQWLAFFLPGLMATYLTFGIFVLLGYWGFFLLCRNVFGFGFLASGLASVAFALNGFTLAHLFVGHITHHPFFLAPWLLWAFWRPWKGSRTRWWQSVLTTAVCTAYTFYTGGLHVVLVFLGTLLISLPFTLYRKKAQGEMQWFFRFVPVTLLFILVATWGKAVAAFLLSPSIHQHGIDRPEGSVWGLLLRYFWFLPATTPSEIHFGVWTFGVWEFVGFVTKATLPAILLSGFWFWYFGKLAQKKAMGWTLLVSIFWLSLALGAPFNDHLPFFNHYHNPFKLLASFIPLWIVLLGFALDKLFSSFRLSERQLRGVFAAGILLLFAEYGYYADFFRKQPEAAKFVYSRDLLKQIEERGKLPAVQRVVAKGGNDLETASGGETSLACYEPLWGYRHEDFKTSLAEGPVWKMTKGAFNLHHPGCFLYGSSLGCKPWDRIHLKDKDSLARFAAGRLTPEWVPPWHQALIEMSLGVCVSMGVALLLISYLSFGLRGFLVRDRLKRGGLFPGAQVKSGQ